MNCWIVFVQYLDPDENVADEGHVFINLDKAKINFESYCDPDDDDWIRSVGLFAGAEDPETGELVTVGKPVMHWDNLGWLKEEYEYYLK